MTPENVVLHGDCVEVMATFEPESVDAIVTDPPYELGFMGKAWDRKGVAFQPSTWAEAFRVAKPGAHLLAFGGTRTYHRLAAAIEDAGWEIRDCLVWAYASGFPKSHNLDGEWKGWGTALKPAWEPIVLARKPLRGTVAANVQAFGTGALNIAATRIGVAEGQGGGAKASSGFVDGYEHDGFVASNVGRWPANLLLTATEWYTLCDDVDQSAREVLLAYFEAQGMGLDGLSRLRTDVRDHAGVGARRAPEVLLPTMQLEGIAGGQGDGDAPLGGDASADERREDWHEDGAGVARLEGRTLSGSERLPERGGVDPDGARARAGGGDGPEAREGSALRSGTSARHGDDAGSPAGTVRGSASPQRREGRQQPEKPIPPGSVESFPRTPDGRSGTGAASRTSGRAGGGERRLTVPLDLIPPGWRRYFRPSHETAIFDGDMPGVVGGGESAGAGNFPAVDAQQRALYGGFTRDRDTEYRPTDSGTYSRFFLIPKADRADREPVLGGLLAKRATHRLDEQEISTASNRRCRLCGLVKFGQPHCECPAPQWAESSLRENSHPTVKPTDLMRHLVRLVTPPGGLVLDPFLGSGTTALAAEMEGFRWLGIEREEEYVRIAEARLNGTQRGLGLAG